MIPEKRHITPYESAIERALTAEQLLEGALTQVTELTKRLETHKENVYGVLAMRRRAAIQMRDTVGSRDMWSHLCEEYEELMYFLGVDHLWDKDNK